MTDSRIDLKSLTQAELSELLTDRGQKFYTKLLLHFCFYY